MSIDLYVKTVVSSTGERMPMLLDRQTGLPLELPSLYSLQILRARNRSSNTIEQALRSILVFESWCDKLKVNVVERLKTGSIFTLSEVQDLISVCNKPLSEIQNPSNVVSLKNENLKSAANRIRYIRDYVEWLAEYSFNYYVSDVLVKDRLSKAKDAFISQINARIPSEIKRTTFDEREGLSKEQVISIKSSIQIDSEDNPWCGVFSRTRNGLIINWLLSLGLRRGELLNIKISDINFKNNTVKILRRADDISDPRVRQPNVKTRDRELPMSDGLVQMTKDYILGVRAGTASASKHEYLFVSSGAGSPLTLVAINKVFEVLRKAIPGLPSDLSPHVLRHTWNDKFSEIADKKKLSVEDENKMRSYLMGWSETSGTAATYTKRHVRDAARKASLDIQSAIERGE